MPPRGVHGCRTGKPAAADDSSGLLTLDEFPSAPAGRVELPGELQRVPVRLCQRRCRQFEVLIRGPRQNLPFDRPVGADEQDSRIRLLHQELFGDGDATLTAGEDLDLASAFTTTRTSSSDDLLPILESQVGVDWRRAITPCHDFYVSAALEGQWWGGVGTAADDDADLGLFGVAIGLGLQY